MAASTPDAVTHGLTLKGAELSWSVLEGRKVVENRSRQLPRGWVALHTGLGKIQDAHVARPWAAASRQHQQTTLLWQAACSSVTVLPSPDDCFLHAYLEEVPKLGLLLLR